MREIKFRGLDSEGIWRYGYLTIEAERPGRTAHFIYTGKAYEHKCSWLVKRHSIGQVTGLYDKNGEEIYEGDILFVSGSTLHFVVKWVTEWARFMLEDHRKWLVPIESSLFEVVGNIHETPELLLESGDA